MGAALSADVDAPTERSRLYGTDHPKVKRDTGERKISLFLAEKFHFLVTNFTNCVTRHLPALASRFGLPAITRCM